MGEPQILHFCDFGTTNYFYLWTYRATKNNQEKQTRVLNILFTNLRIREIHCLTMLEKVGAENAEDPFKNLRNLAYEINSYQQA